MSRNITSIKNPLAKALSVSTAPVAPVAAVAAVAAPVVVVSNPLAAGPRPPPSPRPLPGSAATPADLGKALLEACTASDIDKALDIIKKKGVDLNYMGGAGNTPLIMASARGFIPVVNELLVKGVDVNHQNNGNFTALMFACSKGHKEIVRALLDAKAKVDLTNNGGKTAFGLSSPDMQEFLKTRGITKGGKRPQTNRKRLRSKKRRSVRKMKRTYRR
jgi:hypothetical protein